MYKYTQVEINKHFPQLLALILTIFRQVKYTKYKELMVSVISGNWTEKIRPKIQRVNKNVHIQSTFSKADIKTPSDLYHQTCCHCSRGFYWYCKNSKQSSHIQGKHSSNQWFWIYIFSATPILIFHQVLTSCCITVENIAEHVFTATTQVVKLNHTVKI